MTGHIKLDRKILSWEWYNDANTFRVFVHLLLMATHKDGRYKGMEIKRGEMVTGRLKLASALNLSEMEIRTSLNKLKSTNEITIKITNKFSVITICKYDIYQSFKNENNQQNNQPITEQVTNKQPTTNQQLTTFNNVNNDNNVIINVVEGIFPKIEEVERVFYMQGGNEEMAKSFFNKHSAMHWTERGQPIKNWSYLVPNFIFNWFENKKNNKVNGTHIKASNPKSELSYDKP